MLLERIDKMAEVHNLLLDRLIICIGYKGLAPDSLQESSPCANYSRFDHVKLDCPFMAIQGHGMYRQVPSGGPSQQGQPNFQGSYLYYYTNLFSITILHNKQDLGATIIKHILHHTAVTNNFNNPTQIIYNRRTSCHPTVTMIRC